jgi:hypothetical protein
MYQRSPWKVPEAFIWNAINSTGLFQFQWLYYFLYVTWPNPFAGLCVRPSGYWRFVPSHRRANRKCFAVFHFPCFSYIIRNFGKSTALLATSFRAVSCSANSSTLKKIAKYFSESTVRWMNVEGWAVIIRSLHRHFQWSIVLPLLINSLLHDTWPPPLRGGGSCLRCQVEFRHKPPPAVHGFRHTDHVVWTEFPKCQKLRWLYRTDEIWGLKYHEWRDFAMGQIAWGVTSVLLIFVSHRSSAFFRVIRLIAFETQLTALLHAGSDLSQEDRCWYRKE